MKKSLRLALGCLLVACTALVYVSCEKDEDPAYVGKWAIYDTDEYDDVVYDIRQVLDLGTSSFSSTNEVKLNDKWVATNKVQGTIKESAGKFTIHFSKIGTTTYDMDLMPTGTIVMYNEGSDKYNQMIESMGMPTTFDAIYTVSSTQLVLNLDLNRDGDSTDEGEGSQTFEKMK